MFFGVCAFFLFFFFCVFFFFFFFFFWLLLVFSKLILKFKYVIILCAFVLTFKLTIEVLSSPVSN